MIESGNIKNQDTKTYRDRRLVPPDDDALEVARQNATARRTLTMESEDPGAAFAMGENHEHHENLRIPEETFENYENLCIQLENHENHKNLRIPYENH